METFVCRGNRLALFLVKRGCHCYKLAEDDQRKERLVFLFVKDKILNQALTEWYSREKL